MYNNCKIEFGHIQIMDQSSIRLHIWRSMRSTIQLNPEKGYNAWEYSLTLIHVASFEIYIMGFLTSLLSTIQRTIYNNYLKEVEASKLITYNNMQPLNQLEHMMLDYVTASHALSTCDCLTCSKHMSTLSTTPSHPPSQ
jgi:hypothetical protein